jgi:hypothetical protein
MPEANAWITPLLWIFAAYAALGAVVGLPALLWLAPKADPALRASPMTVRLIFLPGVILLWPLAITRWRRQLPAGGAA